MKSNSETIVPNYLMAIAFGVVMWMFSQTFFSSSIALAHPDVTIFTTIFVALFVLGFCFVNQTRGV